MATEIGSMRITEQIDALASLAVNPIQYLVVPRLIASTIMLPLTFITGLYGMNVPLVHFPGGDHLQFWWILGIMGVMSGILFWLFRRSRWI